MPKNGSDDGTFFHLRTLAAGLESPFADAFSNPTVLGAIDELHPLGTASHAVDRRGRDLGCMVRLAPLPGGLFPQLVVVRNRSSARIAAPAIQSAAGGQPALYLLPDLFVAIRHPHFRHVATKITKKPHTAMGQKTDAKKESMERRPQTLRFGRGRRNIGTAPSARDEYLRNRTPTREDR